MGLKAIAILAVLGLCGGCESHEAQRTLTITELRGIGSGPWGPMSVDTSQLPPGAVRQVDSDFDDEGHATTTLQIFPNQPVKVLIVPAGPATRP